MDNRGSTQIAPSAVTAILFLALLAVVVDAVVLIKLRVGILAGAAFPGAGCLLGLSVYIAVRLGAIQSEVSGDVNFRRFMDQYPTLAFLKNRAGHLVYMNSAYCKTFGFPADQRLGKLASEFIPDAAAKQLRANDQKVFEAKCGLQFEESLPDRSGCWRNWLTFKFPVMDRAGEMFLGGFGIEITEMVKTQAALRESEARYRQIVEYAGDIIVRCDKRGRITYANEISVRILKFPAGLLGRRALSLVRPDARRRTRCNTWSHISQGLTDFYMEVPILAGDGSEVWMGQTIRVLRDGDSIQGYQAVCRDITDRRTMEAELRASEERFRLLYENSPVAYHQIDHEGVIQRVNRAECQMLGYSDAELVGRSVLDLMAPGDREIARTAIPDKIEGKVPLRPFSRIYLRRDGRHVRLEIHENLLRNNHGEVIGIHSVLLDVTQRYLAETLDRDRFKVSEMMAQQQPLDRILSGVAAMICHQDETLICIPIRLDEDQLEPVCTEDNLQHLCQVIRSMGTEALSLWLLDGFRVSHHAVADLASAPGFAEFASSARGLGIESCWSVPIISSSRQPLGLVLVFSPHQTEAPPPVQMLLEAVSRVSALAIEHRYLTDLQAFQASHDCLTRLPNRSTFEARLQEAIGQAKENGKQLALFFVDLDRFKEVNDTFGHCGGDDLLRQVAARLRQSIRRSDMLARIGGDEFSVLIEGLRDLSDANLLAEAILCAFRAPFQIGGWQVQVTASIGISFFPRDGLDAPTLQRNSDTAMYRVKNAGKNSFQCYGTEVQKGAQLVV